MVGLWFIPSFPSQRQFGKSLWWSSSVTWKQAQVRFRDCCCVYFREKVHLLLGVGFGKGVISKCFTNCSFRTGSRWARNGERAPPCAAPSSSSLFRSSTRFVCRIFFRPPRDPVHRLYKLGWAKPVLFTAEVESHFFCKKKCSPCRFC